MRSSPLLLFSDSANQASSMAAATQSGRAILQAAGHKYVSCPPELFRIRNELQHVLHLTLKNRAEDVQRFCTDVLPVFHSMKRVRRQSLFENKLILRYILSQKRPIEGLIRNHSHHQNHYILLNTLTMPNNLSIFHPPVA